MKHLHEWARGRPIISVMTPHLIALAAPECLEVLELLRSGAIARSVKEMPSAEQWLPLYQNPKRVERGVQDAFWPKGNPQAPHAVTGWLYDRLRAGVGGKVEEAKARLVAIPPEKRRAMSVEVEKMLLYVYWEHYRKLKVDINGTFLNEGVDEDVAFRTPEVIFQILVVVPCWLEHGESPGDLYAKARQGDRFALDKLLRVDKTLICDPEVSQAARKLGMERRQDFTQLFAEAFHGVPKGKLDRKKINLLLAALISKVTASIGCPLDSIEIRDLFDAAAKDRSGDLGAIETEFPESPEALKKAIYRAKAFWTFISEEDKFPPDFCPADYGFMAVVSDVDDSTPRPTWIDAQIAAEAPVEPRRGSVHRLLGWSGRLFHRMFGQ